MLNQASFDIAREQVRVFNRNIQSGAQGAYGALLLAKSRPNKDFKCYGAARELWKAVIEDEEAQVMIHGPAECMLGESKLFNPLTGESPPIRDLSEQGINPIVLTLYGPRIAGVPFEKGRGSIYRVTTKSGKESLVSGKHLFLTRKGWEFCENLLLGEHLLVSDVCRPRTNSGLPPSTHLLNENHYQDRYLNLPAHYPVSLLSDGPLLPWLTDGLTSFPLQIGVRERSHAYSHRGGQELLEGHNHLYPPPYHHSIEGCSPFFEEKEFLQSYFSSRIDERYEWLSQVDVQSRIQIRFYQEPIPESSRCENNKLLRTPQKELYHEILGIETPADDSNLLSQQSFQYAIPPNILPKFLQSALSLSTLSLVESPSCNYTLQWDSVTSIEFVREDIFYDLTVPGAEHYFAEGMWHHNTGKTIATLQLLDKLCWDHKNLKAAIVRKTYADMPGTVLDSFENKVLKMREGKTEEGVTKFGGEKAQFYDYPTGSRVWVGGMDHPGKVLSAERDVVLVNQAEELEENDWETISTRTTGRSGVLSPGRLIGDCNPGPSTHWIIAHATAGTLRMFASKHRDNPTLFDPATGMITKQGVISMAALDKLTGVRRKRLKDGLWVAAEGVVYETWDPTIHVKGPEESELLKKTIVYYLAGVDWGWTNPGVIQVWGIDGDGRMMRVQEIYQTGKFVAASIEEDAWWLHKAREVMKRWKIKHFVPDPSSPDNIAVFESAGLPCVEAFNSVELGIQNVQSRLTVQPDGLPRIMLLHDSFDPDPDPVLIEANKPTRTEQEIEVYAYPKDKGDKEKKEEPVAKDNHGLDCTRYVAADVDDLGEDEFLFA